MGRTASNLLGRYTSGRDRRIHVRQLAHIHGHSAVCCLIIRDRAIGPTTHVVEQSTSNPRPSRHYTQTAVSINKMYIRCFKAISVYFAYRVYEDLRLNKMRTSRSAMIPTQNDNQKRGIVVAVSGSILPSNRAKRQVLRTGIKMH